MDAKYAKELSAAALECKYLLPEVHAAIEVQANKGYKFLSLSRMDIVKEYSWTVGESLSKKLTEEGFVVTGNPGDALWTVRWE